MSITLFNLSNIGVEYIDLKNNEKVTYRIIKQFLNKPQILSPHILFNIETLIRFIFAIDIEYLTKYINRQRKKSAKCSNLTDKILFLAVLPFINPNL